ncbi:MAG: electron transfer flavoprotein subunit alpha/FixB family protein [Acidobacteriota bacterium]
MSKTVWAILQQREGTLHRSSFEAIAAAQKLAAALGGGRVDAILLGGENAAALVDQVTGYDLGAIYAITDGALDHYTPGGYLGVLADAVRAASPDAVVLPHTYQTVDFAPRLAQQTGAAYVPEVIALEEVDGELLYRRPILTGKLQARVRVKGEGPILMTVQSGAFAADEAAAGQAAAASLEGAGQPAPDRELIGVEQVGGDQIDLSKAEVIVAVGRGIGKPENLPAIEELAKVLGAELGASRPVIDNGWVSRDRQIGSSGQTVAPKLYVALGVSGAIQHLVGMKGATCVVAVNKDASAPIFGVSRYGIVGDLLEVVPALTEAVRAAKA